MIKIVDPWHPQTKRILARASGLGYSVPAIDELTKYNGFVSHLLLSTSILSMDACWMFASSQKDFSRINIIKPEDTPAAEVSSPTHTSKQGFKSGGSGYVDLNYDPTVNNVALQQNDNYCYHYRYDNVSDATYDWGAHRTNLGLQRGLNWRSRSSGSTSPKYMNSSGEFSYTSTPTDKNGGFGVKRTASNSITRWYQNTTDATGSDASVQLPPVNLYACCYNLNGVATSFQTVSSISCILLGSSSIDHVIINNLVTNYIASL